MMIPTLAFSFLRSYVITNDKLIQESGHDLVVFSRALYVTPYMKATDQRNGVEKDNRL